MPPSSCCRLREPHFSLSPQKECVFFFHHVVSCGAGHRGAMVSSWEGGILWGKVLVLFSALLPPFLVTSSHPPGALLNHPVPAHSPTPWGSSPCERPRSPAPCGPPWFFCFVLFIYLFIYFWLTFIWKAERGRRKREEDVFHHSSLPKFPQ